MSSSLLFVIAIVMTSLMIMLSLKSLLKSIRTQNRRSNQFESEEKVKLDKTEAFNTKLEQITESKELILHEARKEQDLLLKEAREIRDAIISKSKEEAHSAALEIVQMGLNEIQANKEKKKAELIEEYYKLISNTLKVIEDKFDNKLSEEITENFKQEVQVFMKEINNLTDNL